MDWWTKIRLGVLRGGKSKREVLRHERIHWETLKKILKYSEPPGYHLKEARPKPKIGPYLEMIVYYEGTYGIVDVEELFYLIDTTLRELYRLKIKQFQREIG